MIRDYLNWVKPALVPALAAMIFIVLLFGWIALVGWTSTVLAVPMNPLTVILFIFLLFGGAGFLISVLIYFLDRKYL